MPRMIFRVQQLRLGRQKGKMNRFDKKATAALPSTILKEVCELSDAILRIPMTTMSVFCRAMLLCMCSLLLTACSEDMPAADMPAAAHATTEENLSAFVGYTEILISDDGETYAHYGEDGSYHYFRKKVDGQVDFLIEGTWRLQPGERPLPDMRISEGTRYLNVNGYIVVQSHNAQNSIRSDFSQPPKVKGFPQRSEYNAALEEIKSLVQSPDSARETSGGAAAVQGLLVIPLCIATAMLLCI